MTQTKLGSLYEALISTLVGFVVSMSASPIVYPIFGHSFTFAQNVGITVIFTLLSVARGYVVRRWFNARLQQLAARLARLSGDTRG